MVRDIARSLNKKVNLVITGAETELDRTVIDEIGDPLVHLLRNSLDHGLESPEERKRAGKEETGNIYLRAFHSGNHVFIEIEDDGRGIDRDKVLQSAVKKNLIDESEGEQMSDVEVFDLLFSSGFSTAKKSPTCPAGESASMSSNPKSPRWEDKFRSIHKKGSAPVLRCSCR